MQSFDRIARRLGVTEYPEALAAYLHTAEEKTVLSEKAVEDLDRKYGLLGPFLAPVLQARKDLACRPDHCAWICAATSYLRHSGAAAIRDLPVPPSDRTLAGDLLPLFILLPLTEEAVAFFRTHGFSEDETSRMLASFQGSLSSVSRCNGRPSLNKSHFDWIARYLKGTLFFRAGLQFEYALHGKNARYLRHAVTGERLVLMGDGLPVSPDGRVLSQEEKHAAAFFTAFSENEREYRGNPVDNIRVSAEARAFPKETWKPLVLPGDPVLKLHIPRGADLSDEAVKNAVKEGVARARLLFSVPPRAVTCHTWLLDPALAEILSPPSRILSFAGHFDRFPAPSAGREVFSFVFQKTDGAPEDLPENTSLQRALKKKYLAGGAIYAYSGFFLSAQ